jgi:predicted nucleic acid-binding protein
VTIVIDASIAVKAFVDEVGSAAVRRLIAGASGEGLIVAPSLLLLEFQGILTKHFAVGLVSEEQLAESSRILLSFVTIMPFDQNQATEAIKLSLLAMQLTANGGDTRPLPGNVYDCAYIVAALANDAPLVTADKRQAALARLFGCEARVLGG